MRVQRWSTSIAASAFLCVLHGEFRVPGINYPALIREDVTILPGGRALKPYGKQVLTGTGPFAIGVSPSGKTIVTANIGISTAIGINRPSITVIAPGKRDQAWNLTDFAADPRQARSQAWQGLAAGLVVVSDGSAWVSEGDSGRVVELNLNTGTRKASVSLNADNYNGSFTGGLAYDAGRGLLAALDMANARVAIIDTKRTAVTGSVKITGIPVAAAVAAGGKGFYVVSAAPASVATIDPAALQVTHETALGDGAPTGITVVKGDVYVSRESDDAVTIVDSATGKVDGEIPLRVAGLESYRGIGPLGMAFDEKSQRVLVAEAGINAVAVIDPAARKVMGHLPVAWYPTALAVRDGHIYVASARGVGTGPSTPAHRIRMVGGGKGTQQSFEIDTAVLRRGVVSAFDVPPPEELAKQTDVVMQANGFAPVKNSTAKELKLRHVVLIVKGNRAFDEILGDMKDAGDRRVIAEPSYARFGSDGYVSGGKQRFSLHTDVTPNHHELAARWSFADNYYTDSDYGALEFRWLMGGLPDIWSETAAFYQEAGNRVPDRVSNLHGPDRLFDHLKEHGIATLDLTEKRDDADQHRADRFIDTLRKQYLETGKDLPQFVMMGLANDAAGEARPEQGYPYEASWVADNDYALGRVVEFLSGTPWWKDMAVFVTESCADGGADHIDSHRTLLLGVGPWFRTNYVSHTNASGPALLRTIFKVLGVPPMNLYDATSGDLMDMFGAVADFAPYEAHPEDPRLFYVEGEK